MKRMLLALVVLGTLGGVLPTAAGAALTATQIRIGDHPAFVRVVVDFTGGTLHSNDVSSPDASPFDGRATVRVTRAGITTHAGHEVGNGVVARVRQRSGAIAVKLVVADKRFKYLEHTVLHSPERLVIDLWKARPPSAGAEFPTAPQGGCLTIDGFSSAPGRVAAHGHEQGLFEHMFQVNVRRRNGAVLETRSVTSSGGRWSKAINHSIGRRQAGTLEAVDLSEGDGSLVCIAQVRVTLRPAP